MHNNLVKSTVSSVSLQIIYHRQKLIGHKTVISTCSFNSRLLKQLRQFSILMQNSSFFPTGGRCHRTSTHYAYPRKDSQTAFHGWLD